VGVWQTRPPNRVEVKALQAHAAMHAPRPESQAVPHKPKRCAAAMHARAAQTPHAGSARADDSTACVVRRHYVLWSINL
jgi:hypothetical protein